MASCMHGGSQPKYIFLIKNEFQVAGMEPVMVADPGGGGGGGGGDGGEPPRDGSWITKMLGMASNRGKATASAAADLAGEAKPTIVIADEGEGIAGKPFPPVHAAGAPEDEIGDAWADDLATGAEIGDELPEDGIDLDVDRGKDTFMRHFV